VLVAMVLVATAFAVATVVSPSERASAIPPQCPGGEPPPCDPPDTTITTTTTPPPPEPVIWTTRVTVLDVSGSGYNRTMWGAWVRDSTPRYTMPHGYVAWTDPERSEGTIGLTRNTLPGTGNVGFYVNELGTDGPICRSGPKAAIPSTGRTIRALLAAPATQPADKIVEMAAGFLGPIENEAGDVTVTQVPTVELTDGHFALTVRGRMDGIAVPNYPFDWDGTFVYTANVGVYPSRNISNMDEVLLASVSESNLELSGDAGNDEYIEDDMEDAAEPVFHKAVTAKITAAMNQAVSERPEVQWFRSLGYTVSARRAFVTPEGVTVHPTLCRMD
jgi:hypothetical protein